VKQAKIGLLGGTFNPIHLGHLQIARAVRSRLQLDRVLFIPTGKTVHKKESDRPNGAERLRMVHLAVAQYPYFRACDIEVNRPGPSYTYDTLVALWQRYPGHRFFFIIGTDAFSHLSQWKKPEQLLGMASFVVVPRMGYPFTHLPRLKILNGINKTRLMELDEKKRTRYTFSTPAGTRLYFIRTTEKPIAAREIRCRIAENKSVAAHLPPPVLSYIMKRGLYQIESSHS
jgi:nicotinate-nucleotide adenylyltransferase